MNLINDVAYAIKFRGGYYRNGFATPQPLFQADLFSDAQEARGCMMVMFKDDKAKVVRIAECAVFRIVEDNDERQTDNP